MSAPLLRVRDLSVRYGDRLVSKVPEITVHSGECVAIVGESGSGKTSALTALLGLQPEAEVTGSVDIADVQDVLANPARAAKLLGSRVALVSQSPISALNPTMRLGRFAEVVLRKHGRSQAESRTEIRAALDTVSVDHRLLRHYPHQISGGQAQRFAIALALALGVELIVADEPTSALDVSVQAEVIGLLRETQRRLGFAMVFISHDLAVVSQVSDTVAVLRRGQLVEYGDTDAVFAHPDADYTRELLAAVPSIGDARVRPATVGA